MKKTIQLKESDLINIIKKVVNEQTKSTTTTSPAKGKDCGTGFPCGGGCCPAGSNGACIDGQCHYHRDYPPTK